jgi:rubrerythrin
MMTPTYYPYFGREIDRSIVNDIAKAINGEYSAIVCYEQLAKMAPNETQRNRILEIRKDEMHHYQVFSHMYRSLTGRQPSPQLTEACATDYQTGVEAALKDEQETVDYYLDISDKVKDPYMKEQFRRAAADEQNHAVWFLYFLR